MTRELPRDQRTKMNEPFQPAIKLENLVRVRHRAGEDFYEA